MIVGIKGKIGSGKTLSSNIIREIFPFTEYAMAYPIKKIGDVLGFTNAELYGTQSQKLEKNKHWGISGREFMQIFGTDICRDVLPTKIPQMDKIWVRCFDIFCSDHCDENIIVSDVRFIDEAQAIKKCGGFIIEIQRPQKSIGQNDDIVREHISETESDQIIPDFIIKNDSDIAELTTKIYNTITDITQKTKNIIQE
jgi:hypothetical protein